MVFLIHLKKTKGFSFKIINLNFIQRKNTLFRKPQCAQTKFELNTNQINLIFFYLSIKFPEHFLHHIKTLRKRKIWSIMLILLSFDLKNHLSHFPMLLTAQLSLDVKSLAYVHLGKGKHAITKSYVLIFMCGEVGRFFDNIYNIPSQIRIEPNVL